MNATRGGKRDEQFQKAREQSRARERPEEQHRRKRDAQDQRDARAREENAERRADHASRFGIAEERGVSVKREALRPGHAEHHEPRERIDDERPEDEHENAELMPLPLELAALRFSGVRGELNCAERSASLMPHSLRATPSGTNKDDIVSFEAKGNARAFVRHA